MPSGRRPGRGDEEKRKERLEKRRAINERERARDAERRKSDAQQIADTKKFREDNDKRLRQEAQERHDRMMRDRNNRDGRR